MIATFVRFVLLPVAVALSSGFWALLSALDAGGLREIGEPSRKAMIVEFAEPHLRGRSVGLFYLTRSLTITPAAFARVLVGQPSPEVPFLAAGIIGVAGVFVFVATVERYAAYGACVCPLLLLLPVLLLPDLLPDDRSCVPGRVQAQSALAGTAQNRSPNGTVSGPA